jgi:hypothetical protein
MEIGLGILTFGTLGFAVAFGYISARATNRHRMESRTKSALSADGIAERIAARQDRA